MAGCRILTASCLLLIIVLIQSSRGVPVSKSKSKSKPNHSDENVICEEKLKFPKRSKEGKIIVEEIVQGPNTFSQKRKVYEEHSCPELINLKILKPHIDDLFQEIVEDAKSSAEHKIYPQEIYEEQNDENDDFKPRSTYLGNKNSVYYYDVASDELKSQSQNSDNNNEKVPGDPNEATEQMEHSAESKKHVQVDQGNKELSTDQISSDPNAEIDLLDSNEYQKENQDQPQNQMRYQNTRPLSGTYSISNKGKGINYSNDWERFVHYQEPLDCTYRKPRSNLHQDLKDSLPNYQKQPWRSLDCSVCTNDCKQRCRFAYPYSNICPCQVQKYYVRRYPDFLNNKHYAGSIMKQNYPCSCQKTQGYLSSLYDSHLSNALDYAQNYDETTKNNRF